MTAADGPAPSRRDGGVVMRRGDILRSSAQTLVNPVNTVGVMGKGLALQFKRAYPAMFADYARRCGAGELRPGRPQLWRPGAPVASAPLPGMATRWILNFPTKRHWRERSRRSDIEAGLTWLDRHCEALRIESLAVPALGCGEGGLEWLDVLPLLERRLGRLGIPVELYEPPGAGRNANR